MGVETPEDYSFTEWTQGYDMFDCGKLPLLEIGSHMGGNFCFTVVIGGFEIKKYTS